ncbi:MAG: hypothetical protein ACFFD4_13410 [Candidatus Odinarchaeota archaeon]
MGSKRSRKDEVDQFPEFPVDQLELFESALSEEPLRGPPYLDFFDFTYDPFAQGLPVRSMLYLSPNSGNPFTTLTRKVLKFIKPGRNVLVHGPTGAGKTTWGRYILPHAIRQLSKKNPVHGGIKAGYYDLSASSIRNVVDVDKLIARITADIRNDGLTYLVLDNIAVIYPFQDDDGTDPDMKDFDFVLPRLIDGIEEEIDEVDDLVIVGILDSVTYKWLKDRERGHNVKVMAFLSPFYEKNEFNILRLERMTGEIIPFLKYRIEAAGGSVSRIDTGVLEEIDSLSLDLPALALEIAGEVARVCFSNAREMNKDADKSLNILTTHLEEIKNYHLYFKLIRRAENIRIEKLDDLSKLFSLKKRAILRAMHIALGRERLSASSSVNATPVLVNNTARAVIQEATGDEMETSAVTYYLKDLSTNSRESTWPFFKKEGIGKGARYTIDNRFIHHFEYLLERLNQLDDNLEIVSRAIGDRS